MLFFDGPPCRIGNHCFERTIPGFKVFQALPAFNVFFYRGLVVCKDWVSPFSQWLAFVRFTDLQDAWRAVIFPSMLQILHLQLGFVEESWLLSRKEYFERPHLWSLARQGLAHEPVSHVLTAKAGSTSLFRIDIMGKTGDLAKIAHPKIISTSTRYCPDWDWVAPSLLLRSLPFLQHDKALLPPSLGWHWAFLPSMLPIPSV